MTAICPSCRFYFRIEVSGRRQRVDCPLCGAFAGAADHEGGLIVNCVCGECGAACPVDALSERSSVVCPACGAAAKRRDRRLLERLGAIYVLRMRGPPPEGEASSSGLTVNLDEMEPPPEVLALLPRSVAAAYRCVPVRVEGDELTVALAGPPRPGAVEDLVMVLGRPVRGCSAPAGAVLRALERWYPEERAEAAGS